MALRGGIELDKDVVQDAVEQCNEIEKSLEGCLEVLQNIRVPNPREADPEVKDTQPELWKKPSYTVCLGKKYPQLVDIDEVKEDSYMTSMIKFAKRKLQMILQTQRNIVRHLEIVNDRL
ncbi:hypothetical protein KR044_007930 [Drosophila immigrans]|nr:hypothetical protein KR044_007930 [Drosophila immigrans]